MVERSRLAQPLKSLEELYYNLGNLSPWPEIETLRESTDFVFRGFQSDDMNRQLVKFGRDSKPKTLVCHDMMGGYLEDRFIDGTDAHNAYVFYHWNYIDVFVYFSHHLITIPPYVWINAAHKHGVKILGTVISEHKVGESTWKEILRSEENTEKFADALVKVAKFYRFDGWLLNVENEVADTKRLAYFVKFLTEKIHREIEGSEVIWYDSVTTSGKLAWQNQLNESNEEFFNNCDGIFLNYNWTETYLKESLERAKSVNRNRDVYVGIDVWGRQTSGGGGFNSGHTLQVIRNLDLSVAIFAPGWTHEYFGPSNFPQSEDLLWAQIIPFLYIHVPLFENEVFTSSFCRGFGLRQFQCGQVSNQSSFYNLSRQKFQALVNFFHSTFKRGVALIEIEKKAVKATDPEYEYETLKEIVKVRGKTITFETKMEYFGSNNHLEYCTDFSYDGGGCLKVIVNDIRIYQRLYLVQIDSYISIEGSIVYRQDDDDPNKQMIPILVLGNDSGNKIITANRTTDLSSGWKKSTYFSDLRSFYEVGIAFSNPGTCYLGEITLEKRHLYIEENSDCFATRT